MRIGILGRKEFVRSRNTRLSALSASKKGLISDLRLFPWPADAARQRAFMSDPGALLADLDVLLISVPSAYACTITQLALRNGLHAFLDWIPSPSIREYEELAGLAEEAGSEIGISRPLRFHPFFKAVPSSRTTSALTIQHTIEATSPPLFQCAIDDALDLCCFYSATGDVRWLDAQMIRSILSTPDTLLAGLRFQNGCYAQLHIRHGAAGTQHVIQAVGSGFHIEVDMQKNRIRSNTSNFLPSTRENATEASAFETVNLPEVDLITLELTCFMEALAAGKPAPTSILDGLQTIRLIEKLHRSLR